MKSSHRGSGHTDCILRTDLSLNFPKTGAYLRHHREEDTRWSMHS